MGLNIVALISGGKDSFFSILHCQANGHKVVALANLHPPQQEDDRVNDLESYMYQTIGHGIIPLYEQALGLPLYRQEIHGGAVNQAKNYGGDTTPEDETESLLPLLKKVVAAHPEVNAVSTGAILSDYQRTRVENVALRLGLTPLSYLWQWPNLPPHTQSTLLEDMSAVGQDSRIIKVASGGLDESFLWENVADRRTIARLTKAASRFGAADDGAVLGEGGEYETLAISGPAPLWKGQIQVTEDCVNNVSGEAGSASVSIKRASATPVHGSVSPSLRIPSLLEDRFTSILNNVEQDDNLSTEPTSVIPTKESGQDDVVCLCDLAGAGETIPEQTRSIMDQATSLFMETQHSLSDIAYTIITLRDMADFPAINAVYGSYFVWPNPPARVTIACAEVLPPQALLTMSFAVAHGPREGLHVQSRSYWAPANIGPYSQAIKLSTVARSDKAGGPVFIAGQIPLVPAIMELPQPSATKTQSFAEQSVLSLQHLERIARVMKVRRWTYGIAFITQDTGDGLSMNERAHLARRVWATFHRPSTSSDVQDDTPDDFDVWNSAHGVGRAPWRVLASEQAASNLTVTPTPTPLLVVINADSLPRGADIEWVGCGESVGDSSQGVPSHILKLFNRLLHSSKVVHDDD